MKQDLEDKPSEERVFMLTGIWKSEQEKNVIIEKIRALGGKYINGDNWFSSCTHVIASEFVMSEKIMAALVAGRWVLTRQFIEKSYKAGSFKKALPFVSNDSVIRHRKRWLLMGEELACFHNMKAVFLMEDKIKVDVYTRVVQAGGGEVHDDWDFLDTSVTHIFVDTSVEDYSSQEKFKKWRKFAESKKWNGKKKPWFLNYEYLKCKVVEEGVKAKDWSIFEDAMPNKANENISFEDLEHRFEEEKRQSKGKKRKYVTTEKASGKRKTRSSVNINFVYPS